MLNEGNSAILQVEDVGKKFGDLAAVSHLNFEVQEGEIFGIAGPNGAGKTTLFNLVAGALKGTGNILFCGNEISSLRPHNIAHLGVARTFQIPTLFKGLTIFDNVRLGAHFGRTKTDANKASDVEVTEKVLEDLGIENLGDVSVTKVNLFQKSLVMLACALATNPKLLLLDEPVGGLSPAEIEKIIEKIEATHRKYELTILIIEHLMNVLKSLSDRLLIINYGQKVHLGPPDEVVNDPEVQEIYLK